MFKFFKIFAISLLVLSSACSDENNSQPVKSSENIIQILAGESNTLRHAFNVETADSIEKIYHGLMGRTSMDEDSGMLFDINLVPKDIDVAFWMKDTLIPLDMLFIDNEGKIFFIHKNALPHDTSPIYPPKRPRAVLEINGGQVDKLGISAGDMLKADLFGNN